MMLPSKEFNQLLSDALIFKLYESHLLYFLF